MSDIYIAPGREKDAGKLLAEAEKLPRMSPEAEARSLRHGMLKRWADEEKAAPPGSGRA